MTGEFREILEEVDALQTEPFADHSNARQRREGSQASLPNGTELREAVEELDSEAREHAAIDRPNWFGPIEQLILEATAYLDWVFDETERMLGEAKACQHPLNCRCQRQLRLVDERIKPVLKEWAEFIAHAEVKKRR